MRSARRSAAAALSAGALLVLAPVPVAAAQAAPVQAQASSESWYRTTPVALPEDGLTVCDLPVGGCTPTVPEVALPSPYAPGTLHVGYTGAAEDSRTYLELNLVRLPFGSEISGGTLTLPVATDPQAGTLLPETAKIQACLLTRTVPDGIDGSLTGAQPADCKTVSPAKFVAGEADKAPVFTVDLAPFADAWAVGTAALALVPTEEQAEGANWHVAFSRRDRTTGPGVETVQPITAALSLRAAKAPNGAVRPPALDAPGGPAMVDLPESPSFDGGSLALDGGGIVAAAPVTAGTTGALVAPVPPADADPQVAQQPIAQVASVLGGSYAYPGVFLLPLLLVAGASWLGRALTRDLAPAAA